MQNCPAEDCPPTNPWVMFKVRVGKIFQGSIFLGVILRVPFSLSQFNFIFREKRILFVLVFWKKCAYAIICQAEENRYMRNDKTSFFSVIQSLQLSYNCYDSRYLEYALSWISLYLKFFPVPSAFNVHQKFFLCVQTRVFNWMLFQLIFECFFLNHSMIEWKWIVF